MDSKNKNTTLCSEKNTNSHFVLYLCWKCSNFHKIFKECLRGNRYSISKKVRYFLLLIMPYRRHISVFVNYGFYCWRQTFDKMFVSQQGLWSNQFMQDFWIIPRQLNIDRIKCLNKKNWHDQQYQACWINDKRSLGGCQSPLSHAHSSLSTEPLVSSGKSRSSCHGGWSCYVLNVTLKKKCFSVDSYVEKEDVTRSLTDSRQVVIHTVIQCPYACQHQQSWGSRTQPRR